MLASEIALTWLAGVTELIVKLVLAQRVLAVRKRLQLGVTVAL
jgi:hypothetical protein